ncbi:hypothetical protein [Enorma phocaeensis]|uniref:hypothetical protein n=1 Tax=Enorma phocaeensis TaxID=1871019 RepID=UPI000C82C783|nr:hypothetical protein [Enorma phocaeensis]
MEENDRSIGGYFEFEHFYGEEYHSQALALNCARNCLAYLIEARNITRIWVPKYLCASVRNVACKYGIECNLYETQSDFLPAWNSITWAPSDYLYLVDYYGQLSDESILDVQAACGGRLILDEVMAFFRMPIPGIDTIYSCRKFFGVADGAYLYSDATLERELEVDKSHAHMDFVLGRCECDSNVFYPASAQNNKRFADEDIKWMSPITHNILRAIDYDRVGQLRLDNFRHLSKRLDELNELKPIASTGSFMYPFLTSNGDKLRKQLQEHKIYVSLLWNEAACYDGYAGRFARDILPLPIDQRYTLEDMDYECDVLLELMGYLNRD